MAEVLFDERPRYPAWARWVPLALVLVGLAGLVSSVALGESRLPDSPGGWALVGVAGLGLIAWFALEAADLSWLPGGYEGVRVTDEGLHLGEATFGLGELTGDVEWEPGAPEHLEVGLTSGGTLPVDTTRPDELRHALRQALSTH